MVVVVSSCNWLDGPDRWSADSDLNAQSQTLDKIIVLETPSANSPQVSNLPASTQPPTNSLIFPPYSEINGVARRIDRNVVYCTAGDEKLKLDLYYPQITSNSAPIVMFIHGDGWSEGDKSSIQGERDFPALLQTGFVIASVNYRLVPENPFPIPIEDVKCAVRFIRANAETLQINPNQIGVMGVSAGGHLAAMLGAADSSAGLEGTSGWQEVSSQVQAVVDQYGPIDLNLWNKNSGRILLQNCLTKSLYQQANFSPNTARLIMFRQTILPLSLSMAKPTIWFPLNRHIHIMLRSKKQA